MTVGRLVGGSSPASSRPSSLFRSRVAPAGLRLLGINLCGGARWTAEAVMKLIIIGPLIAIQTDE